MTQADDIRQALNSLKDGGVILYPTDTVWGLGCDATNSAAVERLFSIKRRPDAKAMISLVDSIGTLRKWVRIIPDNALLEMASSNRPLTVIYDHPLGIDSSLLAPDGSAAFRVPDYEFTRILCAALEKPLVSTSANFSGEPTPLSFDDIPEEIKTAVDYICHEGRDRHGTKPSRVLKITDYNHLTVIRE